MLGTEIQIQKAEVVTPISKMKYFMFNSKLPPSYTNVFANSCTKELYRYTHSNMELFADA